MNELLPILGTLLGTIVTTGAFFIKQMVKYVQDAERRMSDERKEFMDMNRALSENVNKNSTAVSELAHEVRDMKDDFIEVKKNLGILHEKVQCPVPKPRVQKTS